MQEQKLPDKGIVVDQPDDDSSEEHKEAFTRLTEIFGELPENHYGLYHNATGQLLDLGTLDDAVGSVLFEEDQTMDMDRGVSHNVKFHTMYNMFNSEPDVNQGLNLKSELPVGYGYRFRYDDAPPEFDDYKTQPLPRVSTKYWNMWSQYVNYDKSLRQQFHSTYGMGNVWVEKVYDSTGMNRRGWGVRQLIVRSPDAMYNVVDESGNILFFVQSFIETNRMFGSNFTVRYKKWDGFTNGLKERYSDFNKKTDIIKIPRHKIMYWNYNAYYDDTVYGYGAGVPLVSYARSKIGVQQRILRMIDNAASSLLVFKYGDKDYMVSGRAANKVFGRIKTQKALKMALLPWWMAVEEKELGKNVKDFEPYLQYFAAQESNGIGLPPVLTGRGGTSEGAEIQLEMLVRQLMFMQKVIRNEHRRQLFPECVVGNPMKSALIPTQSVEDVEKILKKKNSKEKIISASYPYIKPVVFKDVPTLSWNIMEKVADKRLRHEVHGKLGVVGPAEMRDELEYSGTISDEEQILPLRIELRKLEIELAKIKSAEKIADKQAKATAKAKSVTSQSSSE